MCNFITEFQGTRDPAMKIGMHIIYSLRAHSMATNGSMSQGKSTSDLGTYFPCSGCKCSSGSKCLHMPYDKLAFK